jgi:large subunit ribosomal protein L16
MKKLSFRRRQKGRLGGFRNDQSTQAQFSLVALECGYLTARQLYAARMAIRKLTKPNRRARILTKVFAYWPRVRKPQEIRMGKGKGSKLKDWVYPVQKGKILFEVLNVWNKRDVIRGLNRAKHRISVRTKVVGIFGRV